MHSVTYYTKEAFLSKVVSISLSGRRFRKDCNRKSEVEDDHYIHL